MPAVEVNGRRWTYRLGLPPGHRTKLTRDQRWNLFLLRVNQPQRHHHRFPPQTQLCQRVHPQLRRYPLQTPRRLNQRNEISLADGHPVVGG